MCRKTRIEKIAKEDHNKGRGMGWGVSCKDDHVPPFRGSFFYISLEAR
jgi:hypothetical protein